MARAAASSPRSRLARRHRACRYDSHVKKYFARDALLPEGWARDVVVTVDDGDIIAVAGGAREGEALAGPVLPGMANLHSHAFQRGMAGLAAVRSRGGGEFWALRGRTYPLLGR